MTTSPHQIDDGFDPSPDCLVPSLSPRAELAVLARALYREGYEEHIAGHISYKQPDGTLLVNPFHLRWDELRAEHVCRIDIDGNVLEGEWFVSTAIRLHLELHRFRDDVTVAVHNHPQWGTVWASLKRVPPVHDQTSALVDNDLVVHDDYGRPVGDADEARAAVESLGKGKAALLGHHGVLVVADDIGQSYARCMSLEWRCRMAYLVETAGGAEPMPPDASQRLARGIDRRGYPGLWEAMARREIQLDPRVLQER
jgi:ribulose-5-phosphate 4-epimerase/fuculose-1-phosphate aldolase